MHEIDDMEIILSIIYSALFIFLIYRLPFFRIKEVSVHLVAGLFALKILAAVTITLIYTHYYENIIEADIYKYYIDGKVLFSSIGESFTDYLSMLTGINSGSPHLDKYYLQMDFWSKSYDYGLINDNRTMIRFNALLSIFSFGYFHVHNVFIAFLSFSGLFAVFKTFYPYFRQKIYGLIFSVFLVPSVLFWASGMLKESLFIFGFGFLIYSISRLPDKKYSHSILIVILLYFLFLIKFYILLAALPGLLCTVILFSFKRLHPALTVLTVHIIIFAVFFNFHRIFPDYNLPLITSTKQHDFIEMINRIEDAGSRIELPVLKPDFFSFLANSPNALYNSLMRPHIFEIHSPIAAPAAIENLFILIAGIFTVIFSKSQSEKSFPWLWFCISFVFILFILCGLTTPVLGALVRYKTPALPFLFIIFLTFIDLKRIQDITGWKKQ